MKGIALFLWKHLPARKHLQLFFVRLFHDRFLVGVTGIIFNRHDEVLLVRHTYRSGWSLPGGYVQSREHPSEALVREIMEETGITVRIDYPVKTRTDRDTARLDLTYVGDYVQGTFTPSDEVSDAQFFPFRTLPPLRPNQHLFIASAIEERSRAQAQSLMTLRTIHRDTQSMSDSV